MSGGGFITDLVGFEDGGSPVRDPEEQFCFDQVYPKGSLKSFKRQEKNVTNILRKCLKLNTEDSKRCKKKKSEFRHFFHIAF